MRWSAVFALAAFGTLSACASAPAREEIPPFRQGVATVRQQTISTLDQVNAFTRERQIERAIGQETLTEDHFVEALDPSDIARWDRAFAQIDAYAEKVERLLSPDQRASVETEIAALGEKVGGLREEQIPPGLAAGFTRLGGLLVQFKAGKDALSAMQDADPAIRDVFNAMAAAIGKDTESAGIRGTVWTSWNQILGGISVDFLGASGESGKRAVVNRYVQALDERAAMDRLLTSLQLSLVTLADTHRQLSQGSPASAAGLIQIVQDEYQAYLSKLKALRAGDQP